MCFWLSGAPPSISGIAWVALLGVRPRSGSRQRSAIAILKYRLYDIDLVIRKTVVFGVLAAFTTAVYVAIVVGLGSLFTDTLVLRIAATALVAVAFQPVRDRANRLANRLVFGERATPYEVLARFGERVGETYASEDVLPRIARVIAEGTGRGSLGRLAPAGRPARRSRPRGRSASPTRPSRSRATSFPPSMPTGSPRCDIRASSSARSP